jgi:hypothetical protein
VEVPAPLRWRAVACGGVVVALSGC